MSPDQRPATSDQRPRTRRLVASVAAFFTRQGPSIRQAIAITLACQIALVIVMWLHLSNPAWALISILVLGGPTVGASISKGALRLIGTAVGAAVALMLIDWFDQAPLPFTLSLFALCVVSGYGAAGGGHAYAYFIGLVTVLIVAMESLQTPERAVSVAFERGSAVAIGVVVAVLVRLSVWPVRSSTRLRAELAATLEQTAAMLRAPGDSGATDPGSTARSQPVPRRDAAVLSLVAARQRHQTFLQAAEGESDLTRAQHCHHAQAVALVGVIVDAALASEAIVAAAPATASVRIAERHALADVVMRLAQALRLQRARGGAAIARVADDMAIAAGIDEMATEEGAGFGAALAQSLTSLAAALAALARLSDYMGPGGAAAPPAVEANAAALAPLAPRPWIDRSRLVFGVKLAFVVVGVLWLWMIFHLPGGMQGMVSALVATQRTIGATQLKGRLRLLGALIGGTLGILVASLLIPGVGSLAVFCLLTAPVLFASAWLNDGSPRYGYLGFQTGFAFVLTLVAGPTPDPNTMAPVLRVCGILIGISAAAVILRAIAPIDAWLETIRGLAAMVASATRGVAGAESPAGRAERLSLRDQTAGYLAELAPGKTRRGWPQWPLVQLVALASRMAALVEVRGPDAVALPPAAVAAAQKVASVGRRLAADLDARRTPGERSEIAAARAAADGALQRTVAPSPAVLARIGILQTSAALLSRIERLTQP